ncbi:MAG: flagellar motor protein [Gammaproteobacteria bacterium RBG_16_57_12]|nr:MAG: flagellar motor protein [Gammaproteobacteria bacterium RBG_16_57_12]
MDPLAIAGILLGLLAIVGGQYLEGGTIGTLINGPAFLIVVGGTLGAIMLQSPLYTFLRSIKIVTWVFWPPQQNDREILEKVIQWSGIARREGLLGLESVTEAESDPYARKGLELLVDGSEPEIIRAVLELELDHKEQYDIQAAKIYEAMGGYCPTIGIIGAVMGLIHVMQNLADPGKLGSGIATAFVATIYGVGLANLVFLPIANKLKSTIRAQSKSREMLMEGIVSIAEGENPRYIEKKLLGFLN